MKKTVQDALRAFVRRQNETLDVDVIDIALPALPIALDGYRFTVVSDLHLHTLTEHHRNILAAVERTAPDCILIAGDSIDEGTVYVERLTPFFTALARIAPVAACVGNNDCDCLQAIRDVYEEAGVTLLEDETRTLPARGVPLLITGLQDPLAYKRGLHRERPVEAPVHMDLRDALPPRSHADGDASRAPSVLLMHQPQLAKRYAALRPSLIVAGHAHGGQFRVPGIGGLFSPGQGFFPRLTSGLYPLGDAKLVVSRGLGNHEIPLRLNNRPHLPVLVLRALED